MKYLSVLAILLSTVAIGLNLQDHGVVPQASPIALPGTVAVYSIVRPGTVTIDAFSDRRMTRELGTGSGFIIDSDGTIATAAHVVVGGYYRVTYSDGSTAQATILSSDPARDIAIVRVDKPVGSCLQLAQKSSEPGSMIMAAGNPFGIGVTVVLGVVSSYPAALENGSKYLAATLSIMALPGYSGGPVMDISTGQVIGVISAGYETRKGWAGIIWSVPAQSVSDLFFEKRGRRPSCAQS